MQILALLGHNLNTNPKEGFNEICACADTWKETTTGWHNRQEERILILQHQFSQLNNAFLESQKSFVNLQKDFRRLDNMVSQHEAIIPKI